MRAVRLDRVADTSGGFRCHGCGRPRRGPSFRIDLLEDLIITLVAGYRARRLIRKVVTAIKVAQRSSPIADSEV